MKEGNGLRVILIQPDAKGMPDYNKAQELMFKQRGGASFGRGGGGGNPLAGGSHNTGNPLAKRSAADPLSGTFSGGGVKLTLNGSHGNYTGILIFNGASYPVSASGNGKQLKGAFQSGSSQFPFSGILQGNTLAFQTGGTSYQLTKQGNRIPANPLQKRSTSAGASAVPIGSRVTSRKMGFSFQPPAGWVAKINPGAGYIMGSQKYKGVILISRHSYPNLKKMRTEAASGLIDPKSNVHLMPEGGFEAVGNNGFGGILSGTIQGQQARAYLLGVMSPNGGGVSILVAVSPSIFTNQYPDFAKQIAASVRFSKPVPEGQ